MKTEVIYEVAEQQSPQGRVSRWLMRTVRSESGKVFARSPVARFKTEDEAALFAAWLALVCGAKK